MSVAVVIPARMASTRLPEKPLLRETGKYLIQHVYEQVSKSPSAYKIIVATDDLRIYHAVEEFGGNAMLTSATHVSGTDRVAEVAQSLDAEIIVNVQGDEPQFDPAGIDLLVQLLNNDLDAQMATLATPIRDRAIYENPNCVKVVCSNRFRALYFSRSPIPMVRDGEPDFQADPPLFLLHLGVYAYRRETLLKLARTHPHPLEECEKLEQLRFLGCDGTMVVGIVPQAHRGVDTRADYAEFVAAYRRTSPVV